MKSADFSDIQALAFDAYGTLFDVHSAVARHNEAVGLQAGELSACWRQKQLQYTWHRSLAGCYEDFERLTEDTLDYAMETFGLQDDELRRQLLAAYFTLEAFAEVPGVLRQLATAGMKLAILSNGTPAMLDAAVSTAGLDGLFDECLSVHELQVYKPDPRVYQLAVDRLGVKAGEICFQSSNSWDAHAAADFGMRVAWVNRYNQVRDRLPAAPAAELGSLAELPSLLGLAEPAPL